MKKSEVIVDLTKIQERLDELLSSNCLENVKGELFTISSQVKKINGDLKSSCLTFSITGRAPAMKTRECRFCGK